jgi:hypothetical protein
VSVGWEGASARPRRRSAPPALPARRRAPSTGIPEAFSLLVRRIDAERVDAPGGRATVRLRQAGGPECDAVVDAGCVRLVRSASRIRPDAVLTADSATWSRLAVDVAGGLQA